MGRELPFTAPLLLMGLLVRRLLSDLRTVCGYSHCSRWGRLMVEGEGTAGEGKRGGEEGGKWEWG